MLAFSYMVVDMGRLKSILLFFFVSLTYPTMLCAAAQPGPIFAWPFKPFRWMGPAFANAFCTLASQGFFNNYGNAGFW